MKDLTTAFRFNHLLYTLLLLLLPCCTSNKGSFPSLIDQGILPISPTNAYLGSNLFLGQEAEQSLVLFQFLKGRGTPGAIEIKSGTMILYYPKQTQFYVADLESNQNTYEWIVRGPFQIEREDYRKLTDVQRTNYEAAPLIVSDKIIRFVEETPTPKPVPTATITATPKITKKPKLKVATETAKSLTAVATIKPTLVSINQIPSGPGLNSDQQALRLSKGLVELTAEGDLLHRVTSDIQTWQEISSWFASDSAKAKAIAEFNGLTDSTPLAKGAKIKIPKALATNDKIMK